LPFVQARYVAYTVRILRAVWKDDMEISIATQPGSTTRPNEDFVAAYTAAAVVLDGLTAPPELGTGCRHGTPWYVRWLGARIIEGISTSPSAGLQEILSDAITEVAKSHADTCDLEHPGTPSSTVAIMRERSDSVDYLVLFDSVIVLELGAELAVLSDDRIAAFAQSERVATRQHAIGSAEHAEAVRQLVAAERRHRNQPEGYWVAGATPESARHAIVGSVKRDDVVRAALLTDGASCLADAYAMCDWSGLLDLLDQRGPAELIAQVRKAEESDPRGMRWPRYKQSDDASVAFCRLGRDSELGS
jgi:hypothetical protein